MSTFVVKKEEVATKLDMVGIVAAIKEMATKVDIANLDSRIERALRYQIMWMVGIGLAVAGIIKYL